MIARVFPRRTRATPSDPLAFVGPPTLFVPPEISAVHVSVSFTWDLAAAEQLAIAWSHIAPVTIGGPATGMPGEEFSPGRSLAPGYTITSRGCPNRCWFCATWRRDGDLRELPSAAGWIVQDDNLLACSERHIRQVFAMLATQPVPPQLAGGLEAAQLQPWHLDLLLAVRPKQIFFAYDSPQDLEPLHVAGRVLSGAGITFQSRVPRCYVLVGYPGDTIRAAERRLRQTVYAGFWPFAMLYRDSQGRRHPDWIHFAKLWARPASIAALLHLRRQDAHGQS